MRMARALGVFMIDIQGPRCETCRFYFIDGDDSLCRRYPPQVILVPVTKARPPAEPVFPLQSRFPTMLPSGWCGEYQPG